MPGFVPSEQYGEAMVFAKGEQQPGTSSGRFWSVFPCRTNLGLSESMRGSSFSGSYLIAAPCHASQFVAIYWSSYSVLLVPGRANELPCVIAALGRKGSKSRDLYLKGWCSNLQSRQPVAFEPRRSAEIKASGWQVRPSRFRLPLIAPA